MHLHAFQKCSRNWGKRLFNSLCPSAWNNSALIGRIFIKFGVLVFFEILSKIFKFNQNRTRITGTLHFRSRSVLLRMKNISDKPFRDILDTHFVFNKFFFENRSIYEKCGKILQSGTGHRLQYGACALHAKYLRLQTHTHSM